MTERRRSIAAWPGAWLAGMLAASLLLVPFAAPAQETYRMRIQAAVPSGAMSFDMLERFGERLDTMSGGRLKVQVLGAGAIVPSPRILDAVNDGTLEAGFAWPQYWAGKHPAASLFSNSPVWPMAGLDELTHIAWMQKGGGRELYQELLKDKIGVDVVSVFVTPSGSQPLGWFNTPIENVEKFREVKYRSPPGLAGEIFQEAGASAVFLPGEEIIPSAERGVIDGAEWINPVEDMAFGFQDAFDRYYLTSVHQFVDIGEIVINRDFFDGLPASFQAMIRTAAQATIVDTFSNDIVRNSKAVNTLEKEYGIDVERTPEDINAALIKGAQKVLERHSQESEFFAKVVEAQKKFALTTAPWWGQVLRIYDSLAEDAVIK